LKLHFCRDVGDIGNFDRLVLLQISTIFSIFHSFYLTGRTTKCCGWSNVSTSCAVPIAQHGPQEIKMMMRRALKGRMAAHLIAVITFKANENNRYELPNKYE